MPTEFKRPAVEFRQVSKRFQIQEASTLKEFLPAFLKGKGWLPPFYALRDFNLVVEPGESLGIIGRNGSGKSTALKLIAGVMIPTEGEVLARGRVCPLIELGAGFNPDLTGRENIYLNASLLGLSNRETRERFDDIVDFSELALFMDMPVKRYSSGMHVRLAFSIAVHCNPDILIIDEGLTVGDIKFQEKGLARMREFQKRGVTIVFVSHALPQIERFCSRVLVMQDGQSVASGDPAEMVALYREMALGVSALPD